LLAVVDPVNQNTEEELVVQVVIVHLVMDQVLLQGNALSLSPGPYAITVGGGGAGGPGCAPRAGANGTNSSI
jgi:hypothetical protein